MSRSAHRMGRRRILQGLGASAMGLPWLRSLPSVAGGMAFPTRLVVFFTPNEPISREYWQMDHIGNGGALPSSLPNFLSPLDPYVDRLTMVGDLRMRTVYDKQPESFGHWAMGHMLTGTTNEFFGAETYEFWGGGISVDQYIADRRGVEALTLGVMCEDVGGFSRMSYRGANQPVPPIEDPTVAFDQLFAGIEQPPEVQAELMARKLSALDSVSGELQALRDRLPSDDRLKLEAHLDAVRDLEQKVETGVQGVTCDPVAPDGGYDPQANQSFPTISRLQMDVLVQALACGRTDVASLQLRNDGGGYSYPIYPDEGLDIDIAEHELAHNAESGFDFERREQLELFYMRLFAELLDKLDAVPEGDGTLLDHTLVLWTKHIGQPGHSNENMLYLLAGGQANTGLSMGRYRLFPGVAHNDLLVSTCNLMGLDDVNTFGDADLCSGGLSL